MKMESQDIDIHPETKIAEDAEIVASDVITIGKYAVIQSGFKVRCRSLYIGEHTFIGERVVIGGGGCNGPNAEVSIGARSLIAEGSFINCAESVTIGEHVAFGYEAQVWTHGVWQPVVDGFGKMKQEPVVIGNEVWLPSRCQVLPGVTIGDNVVVGMGSLVNKDLPDGCLAVGMPAKVKRANVYPATITDDDLNAEMQRLIDIYLPIAEDKGFTPEITILPLADYHYCIGFSYLGENVVFNYRSLRFTRDKWSRDILTDISEYAEDFRDFLRRWGFPFYGGGFFRSMTPTRFDDAIDKTYGQPLFVRGDDYHD